MTYGKKLTHNVTTGQIELVDMTPEEIKQRDSERAEAEARIEPKSEMDVLKETIADLAQQVAELKKKVK